MPHTGYRLRILIAYPLPMGTTHGSEFQPGFSEIVSGRLILPWIRSGNVACCFAVCTLYIPKSRMLFFLQVSPFRLLLAMDTTRADDSLLVLGRFVLLGVNDGQTCLVRFFAGLVRYKFVKLVLLPSFTPSHNSSVGISARFIGITHCHLVVKSMSGCISRLLTRSPT
jgi:hypothetical protein